MVVGGGFGGLTATLRLARQDVDVTLIDRRNFHLFQPLMYQVATGTLSAAEIAQPLRWIVRRHPNVTVMLAEVTGFDLAGRRVHLAPAADGVAVPASLGYDELVVAGGSHYDYFGHDSWRADAPELKTLEGALDIRTRVLRALEAAESEPDPARRAEWLTFVVVGGGPTGVEMAGQIAEIAGDARREFRRADTAAATVMLVEAGDRMLRGFRPSLSRRATRALRRLGVTPLVDHMVTDITATGVSVTGPGGETERVPARTVVWAAGVRASRLAAALARASGGRTDPAGRLVVEPDLTLSGHPEVSAIGDMVAVRTADGVRALPGLAPVAMQQGRYTARAMLRRRQGGTPRPFTYRDKGTMATIGRLEAVGDIHGVRVSGSPAWYLWLGIHLWMLAGVQNRAVVLTRWAFALLGRGRAARLITGPPERGGRPRPLPAPVAAPAPMRTAARDPGKVPVP